ncbi:MAG: hypothetical protein SGJ20_16995 [Planctomycetota bacterium]|nr:hypothetical protein [Planctomycetota bacterium]
MDDVPITVDEETLLRAIDPHSGLPCEGLAKGRLKVPASVPLDQGAFSKAVGGLLRHEYISRQTLLLPPQERPTPADYQAGRVANRNNKILFRTQKGDALIRRADESQRNRQVGHHPTSIIRSSQPDKEEQHAKVVASAPKEPENDDFLRPVIATVAVLGWALVIGMAVWKEDNKYLWGLVAGYPVIALISFYFSQIKRFTLEWLGIKAEVERFGDGTQEITREVKPRVDAKKRKKFRPAHYSDQAPNVAIIVEAYRNVPKKELYREATAKLLSGAMVIDGVDEANAAGIAEGILRYVSKATHLIAYADQSREPTQDVLDCVFCFAYHNPYGDDVLHCSETKKQLDFITVCTYVQTWVQKKRMAIDGAT